MKASHNSATGERPSNIWAKLFWFVAIRRLSGGVDEAGLLSMEDFV